MNRTSAFRPSSHRRRTRSARGVLCLALAAALCLPSLFVTPAQADPVRPGHLVSQREPVDHDGGEVAGKGRTVKSRPRVDLPDPVWSSASTTHLKLDAGGTASSSLTAGTSSPVTLRRTGSGATSQPVDVTAQVLDRSKVPARWRNGVVTRLSAGSTTTASVSVDYRGFRYAYGGDWASRLKLWRLPDCALTTPDASACHATPLVSRNDERTTSVTADVAVAPAGGASAQAAAIPGSGSLVALAAAPSGSAGNYTATALSASATWEVGGSSGAFTWSYPMRVPPAIGGPAPGLGLAYSSSSVDGRSAATNNQPSWTGEGFNLWSGSIERTYVSCSDDKAGSNNPDQTGDLCWATDNAVLSLNGSTTELVYQTGKGWHSRAEDGTKIEKMPATVNGDVDGENWRVTTSDGNQYYFGLNKLPGQTTDTNSTWTVPVYSNNPGEPGHAAAFADSDHVRAWRWNLDYVVDTRGNTMSYWYTKEANQYAAEATDTKNVTYTRGGTLTRIDYGTWDRVVNGAVDRSTTPAAQIVFDTDDRCKSDCTNHDAQHWPDTPWDQQCASTATSCNDYSPTFWSTQRLTKITTKVWDTTRLPARWQNVDSWTFDHSFPSPGSGEDAGLWLDSIVHTGLVTDTDGDNTDDKPAVTLPPVTFEPVALLNRVLTLHNTTNNWQRLANITTETGALIQVTYSDPECTASNLPSSPQNNSMLCYPVIGADPADPDHDITEYWNKYVVRQVSETDVQLADGHQNPTKNTRYVYGGKPAWHYADDDGLTKRSRRTWDQFRGFASVDVEVGDTAKTLTRTVYMRGMNGDRAAPSGGTRSVTVGASIGSETVNDEDQFAGMIREQVTYDGTVDKPVSTTVNVPWRSEPTATRGDVTARYTNTATIYHATALGNDGDRGWRITSTVSSLDGTYGTVNWTQDNGDIAKTGDEQCATYTYNRGKTLNRLVSRITTTALTCGKSPASPDDVISDTATYYDQATSLTTPPTRGEPTRTDVMKNWSTTAGTTWQTSSTSTFDDFGRPKSTTDVKNNTTSATYTPATGLATLKTDTNQLNWQTKSQILPYWGSPSKVTDTNGRVTDVQYDPLGRTYRVWNVGWAKTAHPTTPSAQYTYGYSTTRSGYPFIRTASLNAGGSYTTSYSILDGFLRPRQSQIPAADDATARVVTDTLYDAWGRADTTYGAHAEPGIPSGALWWEPEWSVPTQNHTLFDRANRPTAQVLMSGEGLDSIVEKWRTTTSYAGDQTTVTPPQGGQVTTTLTNAQGHVTELREYTTAAGAAGAYTSTRYGYNRKDQLDTVTDTAGDPWTYHYDIKGRQTETTDPDKGGTTLGYNDFDELTSSTDDKHQTLVFTYDTLGRKTGVYDGVVSDATKRATWTYDALYTHTTVRGQLTEATRYDHGNAYKWQAGGFTDRYEVSSENIVIPTAENKLAGTYTYGHSFAPTTGEPTDIAYPPAGNLPSEGVTTVYDPINGLPQALKSGWSDIGRYVTGQQYSAYGEPTITTLKIDGGVYAEQAISYEPDTRRLHDVDVRPETATGTVASNVYTWQDSGNLSSIADTPQVGQSDTQCFTYDPLQRLTSAWTPKADVSCGSSPSTENLGGPAPYWLDWSIDAIGNRTKETSHTAAGDTTTNYTLPTPGPGIARPHAATAAATTAPGQPIAVTASYSYDEAGNMKTRPGPTTAQTLTWDSEGHLATTTEGTSTTTNLYDTNGSRLIRRDATGSTLYLPGMEVRQQGTGSTATLTATRYYNFAGNTIASRTPANQSLTWLFDDHNGTQQTTVNAYTQQVTTRRQTPYGEDRGTVPTWPNNKGFVGGDKDPTGLTHIGARDYDPNLGRFISVDPEQDLTDPQQWNGYAYANNNPTTFADPSGLRIDGDRTGCAQGNGGSCGGHETPDTPKGNSGDGTSSGGKGQAREGSDSTCGGTCDGTLQVYGDKFVLPASIPPQKQMAIYLDFWDRYRKLFCYNNGRCFGPEIMPLPFANQIWGACHDNGGCGRKIDSAGDLSSMLLAAKANGLTEGGGEGPASLGLGGIAPEVGLLGKENAAAREGQSAASGESAAVGECGHSFDPDTQVLLADGTQKAIKDVEVGDEVKATEPGSGLTTVQKVTQLHNNKDGDLLDVEVVVGKKRTTIHTTQHHLFWDETSRRWVEALALRRGDLLKTYKRHAARIASVRVVAGVRQMLDLTVSETHTYYVLAGTTPVLVHNCGGRWKLGDDYSKPNKDGLAPSMSTMRKRFWKNEAAEPAAAGQYGAANISRMKRGMAPQRQRPDGSSESMELSHEPIPERDGGMLLTPRWPQDHVLMDPGGYRRLPPGY